MTVQVPHWRRRAYNVAAMRDLARRTLPRPVFDFADGAAEDELTLRRNESAFDDIDLLPRPLNGSPTRDLSVELFGQTLKLPVIVGPTGLGGLFWPDGERCAARAAAAAGTAYCLSHGSVCTLEQLAETRISPRWMQVFIYRDRAFTRELTERAARANYDALVLTTDNQMLGNRERDLRNGFTIPPRFGINGLAAMALKAEWLWRMRNELKRITFGNYVRAGEPADIKSLAGRMSQLLDPAMHWGDVADLRRVWTKPLILKGILHPDEARKAVEHGVDAIIVSNHGGRQLDGAVSGFDALPAIVDAVGGRIPVLVDGGIRRGTDVVKALAIGAKACLIGRPQLWGVAVAGEAGVARILEIFAQEIDRTMGLCGVTKLSEIDRSLLLSKRIGHST